MSSLFPTPYRSPAPQSEPTEGPRGTDPVFHARQREVREYKQTFAVFYDNGVTLHPQIDVPQGDGWRLVQALAVEDTPTHKRIFWFWERVVFLPG